MSKKSIVFLFTLAIVTAGCTSVYIPKSGTPSTIIIVQNFGWRSVQAGASTNMTNEIEGGGRPALTIPLTGK